MENWYADLDRMEQTALWEDGAPGFDPGIAGQRQPSVAFLPVSGTTPRGVVIICAGGAYLCKSSYEGGHVARFIHAHGMAAAVLDYRVKPYLLRDSLADANRSIRLIRSRAAEWGILPDKIAILGFSAGGHLAGMAATLYDRGSPRADDPVERISSRPDAAIQCYGSISPASVPGLEVLLDTGYGAEELERFSPDRNLQPDSPPFFMWQTGDDDIVPASHILNMAGRLSDHRIPYEMHIFPYGPHGAGLADGSNTDMPPDTHVAQWAGLLVKWLETLGF